MLSFLLFMVKIVLSSALSKKTFVIKLALLEKENEILKRHLKGKRLSTNQSDRIIFVLLEMIDRIHHHITIVKPETVLKWQRMLIKHFWTFTSKKKRQGRPAVHKNIQHLILKMKNENICWGVKKIQGELGKLNIHLDSKTIWNILYAFRRKGKIKASLTWKNFLKFQIHSIYAMDFFTIDTLLNKRFYVFFIIAHKSREIIQFAITENPVKEFVRQQIIEFVGISQKARYMIHDLSGEFNLNYSSFGIKEIRTSVKAPNMNAIAERFIGSVRREALDYFLIINKKQITNILSEYIEYYNSKRPHQGIDQEVPKKYIPQSKGKIITQPILSGLHHHYFRQAA